jgi:hypothetical protein
VSRNKLHLIIDVLAYVAMVGLVATGTILWKILPPGTGGRHGGGGGALTLLGRSRHEWGDVHFWFAVSLIALVVLHLVFHWKWITNTLGSAVRSRGARRAGAGVGGSVLLVALGAVAAAGLAAPWLIRVEGRDEGGGRGRQRRGREQDVAVAPEAAGDCEGCAADCPDAQPEATPEPQEEHKEHGHDIKGRTTLAEAAAEAGVPVERLVAELKLPANAPPDEQLGRLRREHGFTMEDVRAAVARLKKAIEPE